MSYDKFMSSDLIDDIYAAALGEQGWDASLHKLRVLTGQRLVSLLSMSCTAQPIVMNQAAGDDGDWTHAVQRAYSDFEPYDPMRPRLASWDAGNWMVDTEFLTRQEKSHHVFYQEVMRPHRLAHISCLFVHHGTNDDAFLSFSSGLNSDSLTVEQRRTIDEISPHISRALRMQTRLRQLETQTAITESALNALTLPAFVLNESRMLLWANPAGAEFLKQVPELRLTRNQLQILGCSDNKQWRAACEVGGILLRRANGTLLPLSLVPIPEQSRLRQGWHGRLTLLTATDRHSLEGKTQRLRAFFSLTAAEADLAILLCCKGSSPQECAEMRSVSLSTIRSQIKSIHAKTGVNRFAQLSQLVLQL